MVFLAYQVALLRMLNLTRAMQSVIKAGDMDDVLLGIVLERLGKYPLVDEAADLLLAAFESEESLSAQLRRSVLGLGALRSPRISTRCGRPLARCMWTWHLR